MRSEHKKIILACCCFTAILLGGLTAHAGSSYFPRGTFSDVPAEDQHWSDLFSTQLRYMKEDPLLLGNRANQSAKYRILIRRSEQEAVSVRLEIQDNGSGLITVSELKSDGRESKVHPAVSRKRIASEEVNRVLQVIDGEKFSALPTVLDPLDIGPDGAIWLIEGAQAGTYHVIRRWSPGPGSPRRIGEALLHAAGIRPSGLK